MPNFIISASFLHLLLGSNWSTVHKRTEQEILDSFPSSRAVLVFFLLSITPGINSPFHCSFFRLEIPKHVGSISLDSKPNPDHWLIVSSSPRKHLSSTVYDTNACLPLATIKLTFFYLIYPTAKDAFPTRGFRHRV